MLGHGSFETHGRIALRLVRPFTASPGRLIRPLLTSRSAAHATSPFRTQGEISPGKVTGLLRTAAGFTLTARGRESFAVACPLALPCTPRIRFLFVSPRMRSTLLSATTSRSAPCASLGSPRPGPRRTLTSKSVTMLGTHAPAKLRRACAATQSATGLPRAASFSRLLDRARLWLAFVHANTVASTRTIVPVPGGPSMMN